SSQLGNRQQVEKWRRYRLPDEGRRAALDHWARQCCCLVPIPLEFRQAAAIPNQPGSTSRLVFAVAQRVVFSTLSGQRTSYLYFARQPRTSSPAAIQSR